MPLSATCTTAERLLSDIQELAPNITSRAAGIESGCRISLDLMEALRSIGVFTQSAMWFVITCVEVAGACFTRGGGSALYEISPLQRRLRDLHAAAQHATVQQRHYVSAGELLLRPVH